MRRLDGTPTAGSGPDPGTGPDPRAAPGSAADPGPDPGPGGVPVPAATLDGFRTYVSARRAALRRTAYLMCGDWHLAEDVVQDALARLYADWPRLAARGPVDGYVRRTVVNGVLAQRRRPWRREVVAATLPDRPAGDTDAPGGPAHDGTRAALSAALASLGPSQRAVVVLRYWEDLPVDDVARLLGCSPGTVKSQAARGLARLRDVLDPSFARPRRTTEQEDQR